MGYQMKSYKKFIATAATATLVASAIVPVASASFTDVEETHEFATYINAAVDAGYIKGYADGTFGINDNLKRSQVVIIIGRYLEKLGYTSEETTSPWTDVKDEEVIKYGNIVKDAGVFTGYADGTLNGNAFITRENMAIVLDRLAKEVTGTSFADVAKEIADVKINDLETANADYRDAIQALRDLGISTADNFNPKSNLKRGQFAKFIMNAVENIDEIAPEAPELPVASVTAVNGTLTVTLAEAVETIEGFAFNVTQSINEGEATSVEVKAAELAEDGLTVTLTVAEVAAAAKDQAVVYTVNKKAAEAFTVEADPALAEEAAVEEATAAVEKAEATLATEDIQAAKEAVALVETPKVHTNLTARINLVEKAVADFLAAVKAQAVANNEIDLFAALNAKATPFDVVLLADAGVVKANSAAYLTAIKGSDNAVAATATVEALKAVIKSVNDAAVTGELQDLFDDVDDAKNLALYELKADLSEEEITEVRARLADVQVAIDALPAGAVNPSDETETKESLQEELDAEVATFEEYVASVLPVLGAKQSSTQFDLYETLTKLGYKDVKSANVVAYQADIAGTVTTKEEIQQIVYTVNAEVLVDAIPSTPTQAAIDAAQAAVDKLRETNAKKAGLQADIDTAQETLDANNAAAQDLALAQEKAAKAKAAYEATGLDTAATEYTTLTTEITNNNNAAALTAAATDVEDLVTAYNTAVEEAEAALAAYEAAKGDVKEAVYTDVKEALKATPKVTADIESATTALEAATELLVAQEKAAAAKAAYEATGLDTAASEYTTLTTEITNNNDAAALTAATTAVETLVTAYNTAVEEAEAALAAYEAAKGDVKEAVYTALTTALNATPKVTADIESATEALEAVTELLELNNAINAADVNALSAIVAAYGITDAKGYYTLSKVQRPEFIEYLIAENTDEEGVSTVTAVADFKVQVADASAQVTAYKKLISDVNNATADVTELITALETANADYAALTNDLVKLAIADVIYETITDADFAGYKTLADIAAAIAAATPTK